MFRLDPPQGGHANMAADVALLEAAEQGSPGARVYSWDGLWVTLGRFQTPEETLAKPVPFVVRPTGGSAVVHGHDLTVAIAVPLDLRTSRSIRDVYRHLVAPLVQSLNTCGLRAALAEDTPFAGKGKPVADCFAFSSPNDVVDPATGRKVCGCALRVTDKAALLQASIPYSEPIEPISELIAGGIDSIVSPWSHERFAAAFENAMAS